MPADGAQAADEEPDDAQDGRAGVPPSASPEPPHPDDFLDHMRFQMMMSTTARAIITAPMTYAPSMMTTRPNPSRNTAGIDTRKVGTGSASVPADGAQVSDHRADEPAAEHRHSHGSGDVRPGEQEHEDGDADRHRQHPRGVGRLAAGPAVRTP